QGISPRRPVRIGLHPPPRSPIRTSVFWSLKNSPHFAGVSAGSNTECASLRPVEGAIGLILAPGSLGSAKRATYASSRVIRAGGARVSEPGPCLIAYAHGARVYVRVGSWLCENALTIVVGTAVRGHFSAFIGFLSGSASERSPAAWAVLQQQ